VVFDHYPTMLGNEVGRKLGGDQAPSLLLACRPIIPVVPCLNHASIAVASTRFSTVSTGCDTKYRYCGEFDRQGQVSLIARSAPAIMCLSWK